MQTRKKSKHAGTNDDIPVYDLAQKTAMAGLPAEDAQQIEQQIRIRAHQIADSLREGAANLLIAVNSNPQSLVGLLDSIKAPWIVVSLTDNVLPQLYDPAVAMMDQNAGATCEIGIDAEIAPMPTLFDRSLAQAALSDTAGVVDEEAAENAEYQEEEEGNILGDAATTRSPQAATAAVAHGQQEENTAKKKHKKGKKRKQPSKKKEAIGSEKPIPLGRRPCHDDLSAFAILDKLLRCPTLTLEEAVVIATKKGAEMDERRNGGRKLNASQKRVLTNSTLRKRLLHVAGCVWTKLKEEEHKQRVLKIIQDEYPHIYTEYTNPMGANTALEDVSLNPSDDSGAENAHDYRLRRERRQRRRYNRRGGIHEEEEEEEEEEEHEEEEHDQEVGEQEHHTEAYDDGFLPTNIKKEKVEPVDVDRWQWQWHWHGNDNAEENEEKPLINAQNASQDGDYLGKFFDGGGEQAWHHQMMMHSSPSYSLDGGGGNGNGNGGGGEYLPHSPGFCNSNRFVGLPQYY